MLWSRTGGIKGRNARSYFMNREYYLFRHLPFLPTEKIFAKRKPQAAGTCFFLKKRRTKILCENVFFISLLHLHSGLHGKNLHKNPVSSFLILCCAPC
ncbi:hypothetical protein AD935_10710 [Gluconobacter japonicus]|nr:hypothetical protein AD935_10710 [Gluconobacter japonicus]